MQLDRRQFLGSSLAIPSALGVSPNLSLGIDNTVRFLIGAQPTKETNLTKELSDLVETNRDKLPINDNTYNSGHRGEEVKIVSTSHGYLIFDTYNDGGRTRPYIWDKISLWEIYPGIWPAVFANVHRKPNPELEFSVRLGGTMERRYFDTDFDGTPNRVYSGEGIWAEGIPDSKIIDLSKMSSDEANYHRQNFHRELRKVIGAVREYLKLPPQPVKPQ